MQVSISIEKYKCVQANCKFPIDGKCIDGHAPPATCSFRSQIEETESHPIESNIVNEPITMVSLSKGRALDDQKADEIMSAEKTKVIILAGLKDTGKSTLLGSLMQLFQDNPSFAGYLFAGSETLLDFEEICHLSRTKSRRASSHTGRTVQDQGGLLHLKIKSIQTKKKFNFLLANLSGEDFEAISNSRKASEEFTISKRADHISLFLDSDRLSNISTRQSEKMNSITVLEGLLDANMILSHVKIEIVFSRWDLLLKKPDRESSIQFIQQIKSDIIGRIKPHNLDVKFFEVASRPEASSSLNFGHGIQLVLDRWATHNSVSLNQNTTSTSFTVPSSTFSRFKYLA